MPRTFVWVRDTVLARALGQADNLALKKESLIDLDRAGEWGWSQCELKYGDISTPDSSGLGVEVVDEDSRFQGQSATIDAKLVKSREGSPHVVMANEWVGSEDSANGIPDDLTTLTHLHEPSLVFCLRKRYEQDVIYTATGPILIALNPFKALPSLYSDVTMNEYWMAGEGVADSQLAPHVYQSAHAAFKSMMQGIDMQSSGMSEVVADQSMLVSGESGAGKTVSTKHIMTYLASLSQRKVELTKRRRGSSPGRSETRGVRRGTSMRMSRAMSWKAGAMVEQRILESNPILEAFGNARTVRNDNSSRFGKFIELLFKQTGSLVGARIQTYLLEKVRLVHQSEGERNFHIFYELLAAATAEERQNLLLGEYGIEDFKMTNASGTYDRRDGEDDSELYDDLILAMSTMGLNPDTQSDILSCVAAFLHSSNLTFTSPTEESSKVDDSNSHLEPVLKLLGLNKEAFNSAMTEYELEIGNSSYTRQLTVEGAQKALEAFIKGTYGAMFSFIVNTINKRIGVPKLMGKVASINVLDIFGFESFQQNSFEQLCINYCNEALQQQFNLFIFKNEQEEYQKEGIIWDFVEFPDNREVLDLINKKGTGILPILTDQCRQPRTTDKTFVAAMYKGLEKHPRFVDSALHKGKGQFIISHYAGAVLYDSAGFIEKNKDETPRGASALLESSSKEFVQLLGKITAGAPTTSSRSGAKKRPTVGSQFSSQLSELRRRIDSTMPHYIRCLKPNQSLIAEDFENPMVADQLRYAGVLEAVRVSRVGYSQRYTHSSFFDRYRFIALDALFRTKGVVSDEDRVDTLVNESAKKIFTSLNPDKPLPSDVFAIAGIQKGSTKIFLRHYAFEIIEKLRNKSLSSMAVRIQAISRRFVYHNRYVQTMKRVVMGQASARRFLARKYLKAARTRRTAVRIQTTIRVFLARRRFLIEKAAAVELQKAQRGYSARREFKKLYAEEAEKRRLNVAATKIQSLFRIKAAQKRYEKVKAAGLRSSRKAAQLDGKALQTAIKADKAAAIARQAAKDRSKEVDSLTTRLAGEKAAAENARHALLELSAVRNELAAALAELQMVKQEAASSARRVEVLEKENAELKERAGSGDFHTGKGYSSTTYNDYGDLEKLHKRMFMMTARSQKSKEDLKGLISAVSILK